MRNKWTLTCLTLAMIVIADSVILAEPTVRFTTNLGSFDVELFETTAPNTVANFLNYVTDGDYANSIVHRSIRDFVIQGGAYYSDLSLVPQDAPIVNEFQLSNVRGTIAMARTIDPNSATNQWFINVVDNPFLDTQSGGFAVFGQVIGSGMTVVDQINALTTIVSESPIFFDLPVLDSTMGTAASNLVTIESVTIVPEPSTWALCSGFFVLVNGVRNRRRANLGA